MANVLVNLIGDQMAPNVMLVQDRAFEHIDRYLFISTPEMEHKKRVIHLVKALGLRTTQYHKIVVKADDLQDIREQLEQLEVEKGADDYFVNLTGGTKMMSLGVFAFFSQARVKVRMYYIPVGQQVFWQIFPSAEYKMMPLTANIGLATYLTSYGVWWQNYPVREKLTFPIAYTERVFDWFLNKKARYTEKKERFGWFVHQLRQQYNDNRNEPVGINAVRYLDEFLQEIEFANEIKGQLSVAETEYLIGGWFEEWAFYRIKKRLGLPPGTIWRNVRVQGLTDMQELIDHEFDILFMFQNTLYVLECKLGLGNNYSAVKKRLDETLYRLRALNRALGINVPTGFLTLSDQLSNKSGEKRKAFEDRTKTLRITLLDLHDLRSPEEDWVAKLALSGDFSSRT